MMEAKVLQEPATVSERVIEAVADADSCDPSTLDTPLYDAVDPDALDALYEETPGPRTQFEFAGWNVVVRSDGSVDINHAVGQRSDSSI